MQIFWYNRIEYDWKAFSLVICPAVRPMTLYMVIWWSYQRKDIYFFGTSIKPFRVLMLFLWWKDYFYDYDG